jgi:branched-chain amino acid transport system ATP-binding protein
MLSVKAVRKSFDRFRAVDRADLVVHQGAIVAVIGPNGAGKSTLFKMITGHLKPDSGSITFKGEPIEGQPPYRICRKGLSLAFQIVNVFGRLTVFENVQVAVLAYQRRSFSLFSRAACVAVGETERILECMGLSGVAHRVSASLSHGEQKVLEMAVSLGSDPELLILDEPTAGMSPEETATTIDLIKRLNREQNLTILFCEHDMELVFSIAHQIMVMRQGLSLIQAEPDVVRCNKEVQEAYLGGAA